MISTAIEDMRVLFVLPRMVAGGVERATLNLIEGLQQRGIECCLALGRCRGELLGEATALTSVEEIALSKWLFVFGLRRVLRKYQPTHIVTAFPDVSAMVLFARWLVGSRAAVIVGVHGTLLREAASGGWRLRLQYLLHGWLSKWVSRHCSAIVAVSEGVANDVRNRYGSAVRVIEIIHNPVINVHAMRRVALLPQSVERKSPYRLVALGRLAYEKGFDVLLHAMPTVLSSYDAYLDIYGEGVERRRLQQLIDGLGLNERVNLKGNTLYPFEAIHSADVFVFPSRHEGFGVALVEALACGKQIVASNCPHGPAEILEYGKWGQLVRPEDSTAFALAIARSLSGDVVFDADELRKRAADFTADTSVTRYLALLKAL